MSTSKEPEQTTPVTVSYRTTEPPTIGVAPPTAVHTILATPAAMEEGAHPRPERRGGQDQAATHHRQLPWFPPHRRRLCQTASPWPSPENRSSIPGATDTSIPFSPHPE
jgi:hypothetical protein